MARASAADAALTAQAILDAASKAFAKHGYAEVSLDDVAAMANVTRGAVYHHYESKRGLFAAVASGLQNEVAQAVVAAAEAAGESPATQLRAGSHAFVRAVTTGEAARVLLVEAPAVLGWQEWRELDAQNSGKHLREALVAVGVDAALVDPMTAQLSGAMNEAALWLIEQPDREVASEAVREVLDRWLDAVVVLV